MELKQESFSKHLRVACCVLVACLTCAVAGAANPCAGVCFGTATGLSEQGALALLIGNVGWVSQVNDANSGETGSEVEGCTGSSSGGFNSSLADGTPGRDPALGSPVAGTTLGPGGDGSFSATLESSNGTHQSLAGYDSGNSMEGSSKWQDPAGTGIIALTRTQALETIPCSYAFGPSDVKLSAQGGSGSFTVTAAAGCAWAATTYQTWLHTTNSGSGSGTVEFFADPNTPGTVRQGVITVGGQNFGVIQAPAGFIWHDVFGWLYEGGSSWYHADGFGWMWFDGGGQWIWSSTLKGWLAITDSNSRALWSTQFCWLTPVINDPRKAESTAIGQIYFGKYFADAIPDGWVVSERFGYVWAYGDGTWFWSDRLRSWLGVTPDCGIWCVSQGRFL